MKFAEVTFNDFWPGFCPDEFFNPLLEEVAERLSPPGSEETVLISFRSVFPSRVGRLRKRIQGRLLGTPIDRPNMIERRDSSADTCIWYSGENIRPPAEGFDLTISFDLDSYSGSNFYFPYILTCLDWFDSRSSTESSRRLGRHVPPSEVSSNRTISDRQRKRFACAFIGNPEPVRLRAIRELNRLGPVDVYGRFSGKTVANKLEIANDYRFMLCFENDVYPGYVTEKPLDAWASGCIPIWRGNDAANLLNSSAIVNAENFQSLRELADYIEYLDSDQARLTEMQSKPLFCAEPSLDPLRTALLRVLTKS